MDVLALAAIAISPALAIMLFIFYRDKFNREPATVLFVSFFLGVLSTIPAYFMESGAGYFQLEGVEGTLLFVFFGIALVEELVKFVPLRLYSFTRKSFDEPLDGIVHGVMIGMGFALLENIIYVFYRGGMETGWLRMFTAVPGHASWGVIMGYYFGLAKFNYKRRGLLMLTGLLLATFFHGLYDACLIVGHGQDENTRGLLALAALTTHIFAIVLAVRLIRQHQKLSKGLHKHAPVLTFRYATADDIPLIRHLSKQIWPQTYERTLSRKQILYMMDLLYSEDSLDKQMRDGHQFMLVYNNAIPVGFASFSEVRQTIYKLHKIYLLINQQGRGTGRFTIEQVIADIKLKGATTLQLNVNRHNKAKLFYEKIGFNVVREEKVDIGSGYFMDDYVLEKSLI